MKRSAFLPLLLLAFPAFGQHTPLPGLPGSEGTGGFHIVTPAVAPTLTPGQLELLTLEGKFQDAVVAGGGKAFAAWFAEDAVILNNGKPAILGRGAIAESAQWDPAQYQLTWTAEGAQMGAAGDMGFTWGTYVGHSKDAKGYPILTTGRFMTVWRKTRDAGWKVAMDASADAPPPDAGAACCTVPQP